MERLLNDMKKLANRYEHQRHGYRLAGENGMARHCAQAALKIIDAIHEIEQLEGAARECRLMEEI